MKTREKLGKAARSLRREGLVPAELYGRGIPNVHLAVPARDLAKVFREAGENEIIHLLLDGRRRPVLIHGVGRDRLSGDIVHTDFYEVRLDEKIKVRVPLEFVGEAPAVKEKGGILNRTMDEVEVEALPADLPHRLEVGIGGLVEIGASVYAKDLLPPRGVQILASPDAVLVTVAAPRVEEEAPVAETADVSAVKVETEEKKAERAAEKAEKPETKEGETAA